MGGTVAGRIVGPRANDVAPATRSSVCHQIAAAQPSNNTTSAMTAMRCGGVFIAIDHSGHTAPSGAAGARC